MGSMFQPSALLNHSANGRQDSTYRRRQELVVDIFGIDLTGARVEGGQSKRSGSAS
jgi:hypothetical protein